MTSIRSLQNFSPDVVDHIVSSVGNCSDLLSLALSCKGLHKIIVPFHLHFCLIRCDPGRKSFWEALSRKPRIARRIRRLELILESETNVPSPIVPKSVDFMSESDLLPIDWNAESFPEALTALKEALEFMTLLQRFSWRIGHQHPNMNLEPLFASIRKSCGEFCELEVDLCNLHEDLCFDKATFGETIYHLSYLTRVSFSIPHNWDPEFNSKIFDMLITLCPHLRDLRIYFETLNDHAVNLARIISDGNWPSLRRINIGGNVILMPPFKDGDKDAGVSAVFQAGTSSLASFLTRHSNLFALQIFTGLLSPFVIQPDSLPTLKSLAIFFLVEFMPHFSMPIETGSHVENFYMDTDFDCDTDAVLSIIMTMPNLKTIVLPAFDTKTIKNLIPWLEQLERIAFIPDSGPSDAKDLLPILCALVKLTHIGGLKVESQQEVSSNVLPYLSSMLSLQYVETWSARDPPSWFSIKRDGKGNITILEPAEKIKGLGWEDWGSHFRGLELYYHPSV